MLLTWNGKTASKFATKTVRFGLSIASSTDWFGNASYLGFCEKNNVLVGGRDGRFPDSLTFMLNKDVVVWVERMIADTWCLWCFRVSVLMFVSLWNKQYKQHLLMWFDRAVACGLHWKLFGSFPSTTILHDQSVVVKPFKDTWEYILFGNISYSRYISGCCPEPYCPKIIIFLSFLEWDFYGARDIWENLPSYVP